MTNSTNKMIGKNVERRSPRGPTNSERKSRSPKIHSAMYFNAATPPRSENGLTFRLSPSYSPRTSPGLMAGHFAGGKWSEPPSPTALPKPPRQWTQLMLAPECSSPKQTEFANHLKVLLKVQA